MDKERNFEKKTSIKIARSSFDILVNILCIGMLAGVLIYLALNWGKLPDPLPAHYNAAGEVDRWGSKGELLALPVINIIMYLGITAVESFPQIWNTGVAVTETNKEQLYRILKNLIGSVKLIVVLVFSYITLSSSLAVGLSIWFLPIFLCLMFGTILYFIRKLVRIK